MSMLAQMSLAELETRLSGLRREAHGRVDGEPCRLTGAEIAGREDVLMALASVPVGEERSALEEAVRSRRLSGDEIVAARRLVEQALAEEERAAREDDDPDLHMTLYCRHALETLERWQQPWA